MKKIISILLVSILILTAFSSCTISSTKFNPNSFELSEENISDFMELLVKQLNRNGEFTSKLGEIDARSINIEAYVTMKSGRIEESFCIHFNLKSGTTTELGKVYIEGPQIGMDYDEYDELAKEMHELLITNFENLLFKESMYSTKKKELIDSPSNFKKIYYYEILYKLSDKKGNSYDACISTVDLDGRFDYKVEL